MRRIVFPVLVAVVVLSAARAAPGQSIKAESVVQAYTEPAVLRLSPGKVAAVTVVAMIREGFHINSNTPRQDYLIPTRVELLGEAPFALEKAVYPEGELKSFGFAPDEKLSVYEGTVKVPARLRAKREAKAGEHELRLAFHYQACNDRFCLRPTSREISLKVTVQ